MSKDNQKYRHIKLNKLNLPSDLKKLNYSQLNDVCGEIRKILINTISKTGGHLASNLGTVELSIALHRNFNSPKDKIIWDVGHQSYTHKILTGRLNKLSTIRQEGGISGFPKPSESEHDAFISGHSSTSISVACGMATGMRLQGNNDNYAVAVIGDGAFTGGEAYEGLNNAGKSNDNIIIILNHNEMSISKNVGAFAKYLSNIRVNPAYLNTKKAVHSTLEKAPVIGESIKKILHSSKSALKELLYQSTMFEDLGFVYIGPVDGHDLTELDRAMSMAKKVKRPVVIHCNTKKGKGYLPAENDPGSYHGVSQFDVETGNPDIISSDSFSSVFGNELITLAEIDNKICAISAAMTSGTGLQDFSLIYPSRYFDVGIAEQHAVTFAAGLAKSGMTPVFAVYSSFLQRAYDQLIHDVSIDKTHIVIAIDRAGVVGDDGETHQGVFDVPFLTSIPNTTIFSPACYDELRLCLNQALYNTEALAVVRYPKGKEYPLAVDYEIDYNYNNILNNSDILLISYGRISIELINANNRLEKKCDVLKLTKIFPLEDSAIKISLKYKKIYFFEEGMQNGSVAEHMLLELNRKGFKGDYKVIAFNDYIKQATIPSILSKYNMSEDSILNYLLQELNDAE